MSVFRIYVEKKPAFAMEARGILSDLKTALRPEGLGTLRLLNRYDVQGLSQAEFTQAVDTVFSEPPVDTVCFDLPELAEGERVFGVEYLPGQFDQRADSCAQCISLLCQCERPLVQNARIYILGGNFSDETFEEIKKYLINPVESREASLETVDTLDRSYPAVDKVETLTGFIGLDRQGLVDFLQKYRLAMDLDDLTFCQDYFANTEHRDPTITEIRLIDTYWSDHCRHTTFLTQLDRVEIEDPTVAAAYALYEQIRGELYAGRTDKPVTLMDLAVIGAKKLKKDGILLDVDESEEINACTVKIKVDVDGQDEDWLLFFKNETHNHPTEIEPFGGAATCLGGAIRDPLSGRGYVYQAMRVTGAANPLTPVEDTIPGKLPQRKIVTGAAAGYSSYGNQIGLATGQVCEIYHEGYAAKRLETGAVVGAAPAYNVVREVPAPGDVVILLGGKTGRDGCGGATGSSKSHTTESLETCGAEVQKGNAPEERKIQRLFRNPAVTRMIKRCNDFGAGGVSVAIGELADGLAIRLDAVPKKYNGLDGTELAISESQERMACVVRAEDAEQFIAYASAENIEATPVAEVTAEPRMTMDWCGNRIVSLSREFLNSNGAAKHATAHIGKVEVKPHFDRPLTEESILAHMQDLNLCGQNGLVERFDSTIGAGTVLMPFGGKYQMTPTQAMVAKLPVLEGETDTASVMSFGFQPYLSAQSPYHGALCAVVESVAKTVAVGGSHRHCWLSFQEFFPRTKQDPDRWGLPLAALLGALQAQLSLGIGSIGGKDSMSGTFEQLDVPPTLISFAVSTAKASRAVSQEFKAAGERVALLLPNQPADGTVDFESVKAVFTKVEDLIAEGKVTACHALTVGGLTEALSKMAMGNRIGAAITADLPETLWFNPVCGGFVLTLTPDASAEGLTLIGETTDEYALSIAPAGIRVCLAKLEEGYRKVLAPVYPYRTEEPEVSVPTVSYTAGNPVRPASKFAKPRVLIPVFPGTNCEYDTARAFERAGAEAEIFVLQNRTSSQIAQSVEAFSARIAQSQIVMIPGGFSGGDEPDGSAKFINSFFRNPQVKEAVHELLKQRDGLMLGICNGFQALIKLGLVPFGEICDPDENAPTLTFNTIGRHQSMMVRTRICTNLSPWLMHTAPGEIHTVPISHGEGRFIADEALLRQLAQAGQIATQYVDLAGNPSMDIAFNPNGSYWAVEGITSPDGRVLGKMAHSERTGSQIAKNVPGEKEQGIFLSGVEYFTK